MINYFENEKRNSKAICGIGCGIFSQKRKVTNRIFNI